MENVELDAIKESTYFAALAHSEDNLQVYEDYLMPTHPNHNRFV